jgi:hypothetical protein
MEPSSRCPFQPAFIRLLKAYVLLSAGAGLLQFCSDGLLTARRAHLASSTRSSDVHVMKGMLILTHARSCN